MFSLISLTPPKVMGVMSNFVPHGQHPAPAAFLVVVSVRNGVAMPLFGYTILINRRTYVCELIGNLL